MVNQRQVQMLTKSGFVKLFWSDLRIKRKTNPEITHQQVYEELENEYAKVFCQRRYANFRSFARRRDE